MAEQAALLHALVLDGRGGARSVSYEALATLELEPHESLWVHWDRSQSLTQQWLRESSGLDEFCCDLLLEENTRPRLLPLPKQQLLVFLRGLNRNPNADPEDMVSVRIFAEAHRVISLRLRPLRATEALLQDLEAGRGPKTVAEILLSLASHLSRHVDELITHLSDLLDAEEDRLDDDERYRPDQHHMLQLRRRAAGLRRFLAPQRDIYAQMPKARQPWFGELDDGYWNELNNRMIRYLEELELLRERVSLVLEAESRRLSERMNRIMYRFTVITGLFLPLTFLTGLLGINVSGIPGADSPYGFYVACGLMVLLTIGQIWLYRRWRWL